MKRAKSLGYKVKLYFICTQDVTINHDRALKREEKTGQLAVPFDKLQGYYKRSMDMLSNVITFVDYAEIHNNSWEKPVKIAEKTEDGKIKIIPLKDKDPRSAWAQKEIENLLGIKTMPDLINVLAARAGSLR